MQGQQVVVTVALGRGLERGSPDTGVDVVVPRWTGCGG